MLDSLTHAMRIGVSPQGLALVRTRRWGGDALEVLAEHSFAEAPGAEGLAAGVARLLADAGARRMPTATVVLADELARLWQVVPPADSTRIDDLQAAAALRFQSLYGDAAAGWRIAAAWDASAPFLAAAMPRHLLSQLEASAQMHQMLLVEVVPQFVAGWNRWRKSVRSGAWYGLVQQRVLTLGAVTQDSLVAVRTVAMPDGADLGWLASHVAREALRLNLAAPQRLALSGDAPLTWNSSTGDLACTLLAPGQGKAWSAAVQLAATGGPA